MTESLDDFPAAFGKPDVMPWEEPVEPYRWLWGADRGKPLIDIDSRELLRKRRWLTERNGPGRCYMGLVQEIDRVLTERQGE